MESQSNRLEALRSIREDLHGKLQPIREQLQGLNINDEERSQINDDFNTLDAILEALEEQHVRIVLMGKTNAGKSSLANSLLQADVYKTDAIQGTECQANGSNMLDKWEIHDTPGIMNNLADDQEAKSNIRRSHVKVLVIDDQPYEPEIELFKWATRLMPGLPTVVFFNKYDRFQNQPRADKERILDAVKSKMKPFVKDINTDLVFGSASLFEPTSDSYKRQPPPSGLMDWLYNHADYSSTLIKVIDPAKQALTNIESNVLQVRERVARRVVTEYAEGNATSALIPFSSVTVFPAKLHSLNLAICEIMGVPPEKMQSAESISEVFWSGVWAAAKTEALWSVAGMALAPFTFGLSLIVTAYGTFQEWNESQKRVLVLGEAMIQWIKSGYPDITDGKAYLELIRNKLESGVL
jgi:small GTP-binding protein